MRIPPRWKATQESTRMVNGLLSNQVGAVDLLDWLRLQPRWSATRCSKREWTSNLDGGPAKV